MDFSDHATLQEEWMRELALKRAANHALELTRPLESAEGTRSFTIDLH